MTQTPRFLHPTLLLVLILLLRPATAQDFAKEEADLTRQCISALGTFATVAKSSKVGQRAKQAFDLILQYDPNHASSRGELGYKKEKDVWVQLPEEKRKKWVDKATYENRFKVMDQWAKTSTKLSELHRKLGLKMKEAGAERATYHLNKAIYYNPMDREANLALGLTEGPGFFGTPDQITMARRMKEIELKAVEIARKQYQITALPQEQMPQELVALRDSVPDWMRKPNFDIHGAKSENFVVWSRGTQENADVSVAWAERGLEFGLWLLGEENAKRLRFKERATLYAWYGFLFTQREREEFLKANPGLLQGRSVEEGMQFANTEWRAKEGAAVVKIGASPRHIQDSLIAYVVFHGLLSGRNDGVGQGIVHAITWYMKATSISRWGALPEGTVGDDGLELPEGTNWWMRTVRDQAVSNQDWALAQVPREKLSNFRNDCRLKGWSVMTWMMAAYPDKWLDFYLALPDVEKKVPTLEDVEAIVVEKLGKPSEVIDAEWREWARGDSGVAYGTGYGPPLLPERPSKEELAALDQINLVRTQLIGFTWEKGGNMTDGKFVPLGECEMDAETSLGCELHAKYVMAHQELAEKPGPEIHEEDPAHPEFTRRGQQAGQGNIITANGPRGAEFARDSVDGWIGTPYHRFPMLEHNIKRLGYCYLSEADFSVGVLDMGSLEEPYDPGAAPRLVTWPPHNMVGVPTHFPSRESPNPLEDQPEDQQDVTKCGYTVSLQLQQEVSILLADSSIELWEARKGGKQPAKNFCAKDGEDYRAWVERGKQEVPCWVHTPKVPLNKKRDLRDVLFVVPKEALEANKHYQVRVLLQIGGADPLVFFWEFTTGSQARGLKLK
ncbi:MAG: hypothetical protein JNL08_19360 [Planctomycetes bacterium]|nr:hypothetical protein [Planctomycetota bacterium]